jgi:hypothetical protein
MDSVLDHVQYLDAVQYVFHSGAGYWQPLDIRSTGNNTLNERL